MDKLQAILIRGLPIIITDQDITNLLDSHSLKIEIKLGFGSVNNSRKNGYAAVLFED